jgi:amino acid transporter
VDGDGRGGGAVKDIAKIVIAVLLIILAWKLIKGVFGILLTVAAIGLLVWGGMKLLGGDEQKRIK